MLFNCLAHRWRQPIREYAGEEGQQRRKVERLALLSEIDLFVATSTLPAGKPHPHAFQHVPKLLGADPSDALMSDC
jgi:putative hydrolase of the HAD superfamily